MTGAHGHTVKTPRGAPEGCPDKNGTVAFRRPAALVVANLRGRSPAQGKALALCNSYIRHRPDMNPGGRYDVYILASRIGGTLYIGVTNDLVRRVWQHKEKAVEGFTRKHGIGRLVYYERFEDIENAIKREKRLKRYNRAWKISLIEEKNPDWLDFYPAIANR